MEKLLSNSRDRHVTIYCKKYNRIYLPKYVFNAMLNTSSWDVDTVDIWIDQNKIKIVPNPTGEFALNRNGSSPNGRNVTLNRQAINYYGITEGHYPCTIDKDGTVSILLERLEQC